MYFEPCVNGVYTKMNNPTCTLYTMRKPDASIQRLSDAEFISNKFVIRRDGFLFHPTIPLLPHIAFSLSIVLADVYESRCINKDEKPTVMPFLTVRNRCNADLSLALNPNTCMKHP